MKKNLDCIVYPEILFQIMMDLLDSDDDDLPSATFLNTFQAQVTNLAESQATWTQPGPSTPATNFATSGVPVTQSLQPVQPTVTNFHHVDAGTPTVCKLVIDYSLTFT